MPQLHNMNLTWEEVLAPYDTIFFDAYGVLLDANGPYSEALDLLLTLRKQGKGLVLLSNGAARTREQVVRDNLSIGLPFSLEETFTSGWLLQNLVKQAEWQGANIFVLGSKDPLGLLGKGTFTLVSDPDEDFDTFVLANQVDGIFSILNRCVTTMIRRLQAGQTVRLILPNPDTLFPTKARSLGLTAGALAPMVEAAIHSACYGLAKLPRFLQLGKPEPALFEAALLNRDPAKTIMIGDQLVTDIKGACRIGIDSVLVQTGVFSGHSTYPWPPDAKPTFLANRFGGSDACITPIR